MTRGDELLLRKLIKEELVDIHEISSQGIMNGIMLLQAIPSIMAISDRRLKRDIVFIGQSPSGINIYEFSYNKGGHRYQGAMGQELVDSYPEAVVVTDEGFYGIDYGKIDVDLKVLA